MNPRTIAIGLATLVFGAGAAIADSHGAPLPGEHFIENWDLDGDGQVSLAEAQEKRGDVFYMFDADENGLLDDAEYDQFDETRKADMEANAGSHVQGRMNKVNQGMTRGFNDLNGDGMVSQEEFIAQAADWISAIDKTGDGAVSTDDFMQK